MKYQKPKNWLKVKVHPETSVSTAKYIPSKITLANIPYNIGFAKLTCIIYSLSDNYIPHPPCCFEDAAGTPASTPHPPPPPPALCCGTCCNTFANPEALD